MPPKVADYYTGARLSLQLLQFPASDCSVRSVLALFLFFFSPPPVSHCLLLCPSLQDGGSRVAQGKAPSHSSKSVSFYLLILSIAGGSGGKRVIPARWLGSSQRAWILWSCVWSSQFGKWVVKVCFAGFGGGRGLWGRALSWHVQKEKCECTVARLKDWWWRRKEGISGEEGRLQEKISTLLKRYFLTVGALA